MNVKITPHNIIGAVVAPASKSYAHRLIIAAFLSGKRTKIAGVGQSKDVLATLTALEAMGAKYTLLGSDVEIERKDLPSGQITANCLESGSTLRFLFPVAAALGLDVEFTGSERLMQRPMDALATCLGKHGVNVCGHRVSGKLKPGLYDIDASVSSQFITGLLLALPLLENSSQIFLRGQAVSRGYLDITVDAIKAFGIRVDKTDYGYFVFGNQQYETDKVLTVEGDWSGAAFMITAGALGGPVWINGLNPDSKQGDKEIVDVACAMGARVGWHNGIFYLQKSNLNAIEWDCENIPDLVQPISVLCAFANGNSVLKNVDRLREKESDRIEAVLLMLQKAGIKAHYDGGNIYIEGGRPSGATFDGGNDHRTVMSQAVLASFSTGESTILGAEAINKSYPDFFKDLSDMGGRVDG